MIAADGRRRLSSAVLVREVAGESCERVVLLASHALKTQTGCGENPQPVMVW
jgi:hypothetical protein